MADLTITVKKSPTNMTTGINTYEYTGLTAFLPGVIDMFWDEPIAGHTTVTNFGGFIQHNLNTMERTLINRHVGTHDFPIADTEYVVLWCTGEAWNFAYKGHLKIYFTDPHVYTVHKYMNINGTEREFPPDIVDCTWAAATREYSFDWTETLRYTVESDGVDLGADTIEYEYALSIRSE